MKRSKHVTLLTALLVAVACDSNEGKDGTPAGDSGKADALDASAIRYAGRLYFGQIPAPWATFEADFQRFGFDFQARASEIVLSLRSDANLDVELTLYRGTFDSTSSGTIEAAEIAPTEIDPSGSEYFYTLSEEGSYFVVASTPSGTGRGWMDLSLGCESDESCEHVVQYDYCPEFVTDWAGECYSSSTDDGEALSDEDKQELWRDCLAYGQEYFDEYCANADLSRGDYICEGTVEEFLDDVFEPYCSDLPAPDWG
jgi:hypothetical protein